MCLIGIRCITCKLFYRNDNQTTISTVASETSQDTASRNKLDDITSKDFRGYRIFYISLLHGCLP